MKHLKRRLLVAVVGVTALSLIGSSAAANPIASSPDGVDAGPISGSDLAAAGALAGSPAAVPITLITGDRVLVGIDADQTPTIVDVAPAARPDGAEVVINTFIRDGHPYVVPEDAFTLIADGVLDWELFNVTKLAELAAHSLADDLPVIISNTDQVAATLRRAPVGMTAGRPLPSINATAMTVDAGGDWWRAVLTEADGDATTSGSFGLTALASTAPLAGVEKVWLNEVLEVQLVDSVPMIGTPVAWGAGLDGTGVTVAVLDTGIDTNHPDLADRVIDEADFTGSGNNEDGHGHGTHVGGTIAGTGAASGGSHTGVAPGAQLISGKVCTPGGQCPFDAIIAGMEWAAQSGAQVVNMSLGGAGTDGTDPMSEALNTLSLEHDTLFVTSAGNSGPGAETVGRPAVADEALAVAAVDKDGEMANFSSRGPRPGDGAPKPDIAGPGVAIEAPRAAGTSMGTPVDTFYTTASGTSMSSPHVAGAAAIVAQQHPELTARQLKALLMSTAEDLGHDLYAQGAGLVDVARAVDPEVFSDGAAIFGRLTFPHAPVTRTITYANLTDEPITLFLDARLSDFAGEPAAAGLLALSADQVTVPAEGTAQVDVILDGSVLGADGVYGAYSGAVDAADASGDVRASSRVAAFLEPERFEVTVEVIAPTGATDVSYGAWALVPLDGQVHLHEGVATHPADQAASWSVFGGSYAVRTSVTWVDAAGVPQRALPVAPEFEVSGPTTVQLDLRQAQKLAVQVPEATESYQARFGYERVSATGSWGASAAVAATYPAEPHWWMLPTDPVTLGEFGFSHQHLLAPPLASIRTAGGGTPIQLEPRYPTAHASVAGGSLTWLDEDLGDAFCDENPSFCEGLDGPVCEALPLVCGASQQYRLPVPKLTGIGSPPRDLVYGGQGLPEDLAGRNLAGRLVLLTPADICTPNCDFPALHERVSDAAARGAVGVLVAAETGRPGISRPASSIECTDGPDDCPPIPPYTPVPIATVAAGAASQLIQRLERGLPVRGQVDAGPELAHAYALAYNHQGQVPSDLTYQVSESDLYQVDHHLHTDGVSETSGISWLRRTPTGQELEREIAIPNVSGQRTLTTYVGPLDGEVIHEFQVGLFEYAEPFIPAVDEGGQIIVHSELHHYVLDDSSRQQDVSWNARPFVPGAAQLPTTASGFAPAGFANADLACAGCRQGDVFYPVLYVTSGSGHRSSFIGIVNDDLLTETILGLAPCDTPQCQLRLYDADGEELPQRLIRREVVIANPTEGLEITTRAVPGGQPAGAVPVNAATMSDKEVAR